LKGVLAQTFNDDSSLSALFSMPLTSNCNDGKRVGIWLQWCQKNGSTNMGKLWAASSSFSEAKKGV